MCGIFGAVVQNSHSLHVQELEKIVSVLRHRGPDDEGFFLAQKHELNPTGDSLSGSVALGQTRLSIIDLSPSGHQPMCNANRSVWIVFNGEIYNYQELRSDLIMSGHSFHGDSDTEVLLAAYDVWGLEESLSRLNGMFAFALWDSKTKQMLVARDHTGIKPLYYHVSTSGNFYCASELKAILQVPGFQKKIDHQSLDYYLSLQYIPAPHTIFEQTYKLLPGHYLVVQNGQVLERQYWQLPAPHRISLIRSEADYLSELEELILSSVQYQMISDVPLGAFLSGGIDSSLVVAAMSQLSHMPVETFTIGYSESDFSEAEHARTVADYLGTNHHELYVTPQDAIGVLNDFVQIYDEPFADTSAIPTYLVAKFARSKVTVSLSGDGGDELFCGYKNYRRLKLGQSIYHLPWSMRRILASGIMHVPHRIFRYSAEYLRHKDPIDLYYSILRLWREPELALLTSNSGFDVNDHLHKSRSRVSQGNDNTFTNVLEMAMITDIATYLPDAMLTKVDRATMAVSLEARVPLLDHRIVEFAARLPLSMKYRGNVQKYLLKQLLYKYVPQDLVDKPKQGFRIPLEKWLKTDLRDLTDEYLSPRRMQAHGVFDVSYLTQIKDEFDKGYLGHGRRLWAIMVYNMWYEKYM